MAKRDIVSFMLPDAQGYADDLRIEGVEAGGFQVDGKSPVGNPYDYFGALDKDTKLFVQKVADQTVQKFFGRE